jgi:SAM-dependent methyltransferase
MNPFRLLLAHLRGGDYLHPGEEEAIDMMLKKALSLRPTLKEERILDIVSGLGGTANYLYQKGYHNVQGIDIDSDAIVYAQKKYSPIPFQVADALALDTLFPPSHFSFSYLFNVLYVIQDKPLFLKKVTTISKPESLLVIFDYTQVTSGSSLQDLEEKFMYPLEIEKLEKELITGGWEILVVDDLTVEYKVWYERLLEKLNTDQFELEKNFFREEISRVKITFQNFLDLLNKGVLGGAMVFARKI